MPIFIFVSGYLSKIGPDTGVKSFKNILIPYFLFSTLWIFFAFFKYGNLSFLPYFFPEAGLWYLLCLYFWRTLLPGIDTVKYALLISIFPALYMGTLSINLIFLSISQVVCYLPIFLFGFYFKKIREKVQIKNIYVAFGGFFVLLLLFAVIIQNHGALLCFKFSYNTLGLNNSEGALLTLLTLIVTMVLLTFLFYIMTSKKTVLTNIGKNSLAVYVFHFYIFLSLPGLLEYMGLSFILSNFYLSMLYVTLGPLIVVYILSRDIITEWTNKLIFYFTNIITGNMKLASIPESKNESILDSKLNSFMFKIGLRK